MSNNRFNHSKIAFFNGEINFVIICPKTSSKTILIVRIRYKKIDFLSPNWNYHLTGTFSQADSRRPASEKFYIFSQFVVRRDR